MLKILCESYFPFVAIVRILCFYCVCSVGEVPGIFMAFPEHRPIRETRRGPELHDYKAQQVTFVLC